MSTITENTAASNPGAPAARGAEHTLRWVLAHEPPVVFEDASEQMAEAIREGTDGAIDVALSLGDEFAASRGEPRISRAELVRCVQRGEVEMAHLYVAALGAVHDPLWAIELPFLFEDYPHAERVFEGSAATRLMEGLPAHGLRGLGFAYSGGYRIVPTLERELRTIEDFRGMRLRTAGNPVPEAFYAELGAHAQGADLDRIEAMTQAGAIEGCEITYVRYAATGLDRVFDVINETGHSLFTTMMVVNERWFTGLSEAHQATVADAARAACRTERATAIDEEQKTLSRMAGAGKRIVTMERGERARLAEIGRSIHPRFEERFGDVVSAIRDA